MVLDKRSHPDVKALRARSGGDRRLTVREHCLGALLRLPLQPLRLAALCSWRLCQRPAVSRIRHLHVRTSLMCAVCYQMHKPSFSAIATQSIMRLR